MRANEEARRDGESMKCVDYLGSLVFSAFVLLLLLLAIAKSCQ